MFIEINKATLKFSDRSEQFGALGIKALLFYTNFHDEISQGDAVIGKALSEMN
jgi:hypothetical protein